MLNVHDSFWNEKWNSYSLFTYLNGIHGLIRNMMTLHRFYPFVFYLLPQSLEAVVQSFLALWQNLPCMSFIVEIIVGVMNVIQYFTRCVIIYLCWDPSPSMLEWGAPGPYELTCMSSWGTFTSNAVHANATYVNHIYLLQSGTLFLQTCTIFTNVSFLLKTRP